MVGVEPNTTAPIDVWMFHAGLSSVLSWKTLFSRVSDCIGDVPLRHYSFLGFFSKKSDIFKLSKKSKKTPLPGNTPKVSEQIVMLIKIAGLTQTELSVKTGVNRTRISKIINSEAVPSTKEIDAFAEFFGYRLAKIVSKDEE